MHGWSPVSSLPLDQECPHYSKCLFTYVYVSALRSNNFRLSILMQWAEGGSLDDLIDARLGRRAPKLPHLRTTATTPTGDISAPPSPAADPEENQPYSRNARIRAFRALQRAPPEERERLRHEMGLSGNGESSQGSKKAPGDWKPVHLFSAEEVHDLFEDIVSGLAFLVRPSVYRDVSDPHWRYSMTSRYCTWT